MPISISGYNNLTIHVFQSGLSEITDSSLALAEQIAFSQIYPGGLFNVCSFFVPRDVTRAWQVQENQRVVLMNGLIIVWEGKIIRLANVLDATAQGVKIEAAGYWGQLLGKRSWNMRWADQRLGQNVWVTQTYPTAASPQQFSEDRLNRIRVTPTGASWINAQGAVFKYTMPTGASVRYIDFAYDLQEGGQSWNLYAIDATSSITWSSTSSGSGIVNLTPAFLRQTYQIQMSSSGNQTPVTASVIYGQFTSLMVYGSSTSPVTPTSVVKDIQSKWSDISTDQSQIGTNSFVLEPFITNNHELVTNILQRAVSYGDSAGSSWSVGVHESDSTGLPIVYFESYPPLTDYDYAIRLDEPNLLPPINIVRDLDRCYNWIAVTYQDELGTVQVVTPDDNATLKDTTSINNLGGTPTGERHLVIPAGQATSITAVTLGQRYLAAYKDVKYIVNGPIQVKGYIRGKQGNPIPVSQIRAGKRIKIENYINEQTSAGNDPTTFMITQMDYRDEDGGIVSLMTGVPDSISVYLAQLQFMNDRKLI